jgi:hypothetical protein
MRLRGWNGIDLAPQPKNARNRQRQSLRRQRGCDVARPQHDSNARQEYHSEKEICAVLSDFGISEGAIVSQLRLLSKTGVNEQLKFPPMDVPLHRLLSLGFRL